MDMLHIAAVNALILTYICNTLIPTFVHLVIEWKSKLHKKGDEQVIYESDRRMSAVTVGFSAVIGLGIILIVLFILDIPIFLQHIGCYSKVYQTEKIKKDVKQEQPMEITNL